MEKNRNLEQIGLWLIDRKNLIDNHFFQIYKTIPFIRQSLKSKCLALPSDIFSITVRRYISLNVVLSCADRYYDFNRKPIKVIRHRDKKCMSSSVECVYNWHCESSWRYCNISIKGSIEYVVGTSSSSLHCVKVLCTSCSSSGSNISGGEKSLHGSLCCVLRSILPVLGASCWWPSVSI